MGRKTKGRLPYDDRGGVCVLSKNMLNSEAYLSLSAQAKVLMLLLQMHWRNDRPIGYGVREAMAKIPCAKGTAQAAFKELEEAGFIVMVNESLFNSRTKSKSRTWRPTWMPYMDKEPTHDWENQRHLVNTVPGGSATGPKSNLRETCKTTTGLIMNPVVRNIGIQE